uniref:Interleukin-1 n=1 Tax=Salvator merianae TaxID=96440 RepID=A0A8D0EA71_SALMN
KGGKFREIVPRLFRLWDINQKFLFLLNNILIAAPQNFNATPTALTHFYNILHCLLVLANDGFLFSQKKNIMDLYNKRDEFKSYTFYSKTDGNDDTCSFESAAFPGWYISTSPEPDQPVGLSQQGGSGITLFYFEREDSL